MTTWIRWSLVVLLLALVREDPVGVRADDEHVRYGSLKKRMTRHRSKVRAAKANTKGIKKLNPFVAQVLVKK